MIEDLIPALSVAIASSIPSVGAIYAIATVGTTMAGAGTEKPEILTKALIAVVLAEAIAIYGLLTSFMLITKIPTITTLADSYKALAASLTMAISGLTAGLGIARAGSAMAGAMLEKPETFSKNVVGVVLAEAIAIYGLLVAFMLIAQIGVAPISH
jgi:ATP synthase proteolipid subunit